jgi:transposase InsO family protein
MGFPQFIYTKNIIKRGKGPAKRHRFDLACQKHGIRHKTTKPYRPQTNGQVERMNRTLKDATTKRYHYENVEQLKRHLDSFLHHGMGLNTWGDAAHGWGETTCLCLITHRHPFG